MLLNYIASALHPAPQTEIVQRILWALTFAAQLVLIVVLLGRDRARRYPWFTTGIVVYALQLLVEELLAGRMAPLPLNEILISLTNVEAIVSLLVLVELARRTFAGLQRSLWVVNGAGLLVVAGGLLYVWGPWPTRTEIAVDSLIGKLRLMQLVGQKGNLLVAMLTVGLGLLVVLLGRRYKAAWRSHTQMMLIGLSTVAISMLALQGSVQYIIKTVHPRSQEEYQHILGVLTNMVNANKAVYVAALIWWIIWLWRDEPGTPTAATATDPEADESAKAHSAEDGM